MEGCASSGTSTTQMNSVQTECPKQNEAKHALRWQSLVAKYVRPSGRIAAWQVINTLVPLFTLLFLMSYLRQFSYAWVLLLSIPAAGLLVRTFIIMHDCGHGSFTPSKRWNDIIGFITGVLTLTPYLHWRREHAIHHAGSGNLDERGFGDITTLTVKEYQALPWWRKAAYRLYRNPLVLLGFGPIWITLKHRIPNFNKAFGFREHLNVYLTDVVLVIMVLVAAWAGVLTDFLVVYLPTVLIAGAAGIWLFYVQHQMEEAYWRHSDNWDYAAAALKGSTYLKLPAVLHWFTGHIGLHPLHHLSPRIPNYRLKACFDENPEFQSVPTISIADGIRSLSLKLFDEDSGRLVGFGAR